MHTVKVLACCICFGFFLPVLSVAHADETAEYTKRLTDLFTRVGKEGATEDFLKPYYNKLWDFADQFPKSRFADDAKYLLWMIEYMGATSRPDLDEANVERQIQRMSQFVKDHPDGKIEDLTVSTIKNIFGQTDSWFILRLPYRHTVEYMKAFKAFITKDYAAAVELYSSLKTKLDAEVGNDYAIATEIYMPLWGCLKKQQKFAEAKALIEEGIRKYPGTDLASRLQQIQQREY